MRIQVFLLALLLSVPAAAGCSTQQTSSPVTAHARPERPPSALACQGSGVRIYSNADHSLWMRARYELDERRVEIACIYDTPDPGFTRRDDRYPVRYWPTCVRPLDNTHFCVAGKSALTGNAILEIWTLAPPEFVHASDPKALATISGGRVTGIEELYDSAVDGRMLVDEILPIHAEGQKRALVRFFDSGEVCAMDLGTGALKLVASPVARPASFTIPLLAIARVGDAGGLANGEWAYTFRVPGKTDNDAPGGEEPRIVMLWDRNHDGTIESFETMSAAEYTRRGYSAPNVWSR